MLASNGLLYPILGFTSCVAFIFMSFGDLRFDYFKEPENGFMGRNVTQFMVDGKAFYVNRWNSYWLMDQAVEEFNRPRVRAMLQAGSKMGLTVCRTWAFNDGAYNALQISPGWFHELVFKVSDTLFTWVDLQAKLNSELLYNLGNFINRVLDFIAKDPE